MITFEELKKILRIDYANYIRPLVIKDKCEFCGCKENLVVHHDKEFSILLDKTLKELDLYKLEFNEDEVNLIKTYMLGKQIQIKNITLCNKCHAELHSEKGGFASIGKHIDINKIKEMKRKKEKEIELQKKEKELEEYLETLIGKIMYTTKDRKELIEIINVRSDGHLIKSIDTLNGALAEMGSNYRIIQMKKITKTIDGKKKQFKTPWKVISINESEK